MLDVNFENTPETRPFFALFLPTGTSTLDAAWGGGLPDGGICELRADGAVDFTAIIRQLIDGILDRGENVAYFSIVDNPLPSPIPEGHSSTPSEDGTPRGQLDAYCWSTYGQVERKLATLQTADKDYAAIFVDVFSSNPSGCPDPRFDDEGLPCHPHHRNSRNAFLRYCREVVESLGCSLLLLEHTLKESADDPLANAWTPHLAEDALVDARTIIVPWKEAPGIQFDDGLVPQPCAAAWTSTRYLEKTVSPAPLYPTEDGAIDDEMSLAALLVLYEVIQPTSEGFLLPEVTEPVADREAVRDWVVANFDLAKSMALNIAR
jgi:hypothetical protein